MKVSKKGVTLVELLVVLAVLVILAAVMIPIITGVMNKTNEQTDEVCITHFRSDQTVVKR